MRTRRDFPIADATQSPHLRKADTSTVITLTARGEAVFDEFAAAWCADLMTGPAGEPFGVATPEPGAIAGLLDRVLNADLAELCAAVTAVAHAGSRTANGINHDQTDQKLPHDRNPHEADREIVRSTTIQPGGPDPDRLCQRCRRRRGLTSA